MEIHESSPGGSSSAKLARECRGCVQTHWYPDVPAGSVKDGYRSENLEQQTFPDACFDMVITQDVFEHVLDPARGFAEVARTLKPGGAHVFTVPWYYWKPTLVRAVRQPDGTVRHLAEADYHGNPIDAKGSLVVTEWGVDLTDFVYRCSGLTTTAVHLHDRRQGIEGKFIEVFISRKPEIGPAHSRMQHFEDRVRLVDKEEGEGEGAIREQSKALMEKDYSILNMSGRNSISWRSSCPSATA